MFLESEMSHRVYTSKRGCAKTRGSNGFLGLSWFAFFSTGWQKPRKNTRKRKNKDTMGAAVGEASKLPRSLGTSQSLSQHHPRVQKSPTQRAMAAMADEPTVRSPRSIKLVVKHFDSSPYICRLRHDIVKIMVR